MKRLGTNALIPIMVTMIEAEALRVGGGAGASVQGESYLKKPETRPVSPPGGRNARCQCGSGKKFKKCCWVKEVR